MSEDINYRSNPLHGLSLKNLLTELVEHYDFDILYAYLNINCFKMNPSVESSVKFLKKTEWAREKIESFYLYQYKNLPSPSDEQFALPPRDRIIPDDQTPGEPMMLSIEDAERVREKQAKRAAKLMPRRSKASGRNASGARSHDAYARRGYDASSDTRGERERTAPPHEDSNALSPSADPWSKWR